MPCVCEDREAIVGVLNEYARCLDDGDWSGLSSVFHPDAVGIYGRQATHGRDAVVASIASFLEPCGPSQHLLGNHQVRVEGDLATSRCRARVIHVGAGERASLTPYESIGTYLDELVRTPDGWRITRREFDVKIQTGDIRILMGTATTAQRG